MDVREGELVSLVGPSGCGKTTVLKILAGLHEADGGTIRIGNAKTPFDPARDIGMVFQQALLLKWRTILDNVLLPANIVGLPMKAARARVFGRFMHRMPHHEWSMIRRATAVLLTLLLTLPSANVVAASHGTIEGSVTVADRPLRGATLAFIDLSSGAVHRASSDGAGHFNASVPAGQYAVTTESGAGLVVDQAPAAIVVDGGRTVVADVGLLAMPGAMIQDATAQDAGTQVEAPPAMHSPLRPRSR